MNNNVYHPDIVHLIADFWLIEQPNRSCHSNSANVIVVATEKIANTIVTTEQSKKRYLDLVTNANVINKISSSQYLLNTVEHFKKEIITETSEAQIVNRSSKYSDSQNSKQGSANCYYGRFS